MVDCLFCLRGKKEAIESSEKGTTINVGKSPGEKNHKNMISSTLFFRGKKDRVLIIEIIIFEQFTFTLCLLLKGHH